MRPMTTSKNHRPHRPPSWREWTALAVALAAFVSMLAYAWLIVAMVKRPTESLRGPAGDQPRT